MKIASFFKVLFLLLLSSGFSQAQDVIYSEDFNDDIGKGIDGGSLNDITGVDWILDVSACSFASAGDYIKVVDTGNDRLEAVDCDGEAIWKTPIMDLSGHKDVEISVYTGETGSGSKIDNKYIMLAYILDGGVEVTFFESTVNWTSSIATINGLNGTSLQIVARMKTTYASDKIYIDEVLVTGSPLSTGNDDLTLLLEPIEQVEPQNISPIDNHGDSSISLFKFRLSESGSEDDLPTHISSLKLTNIAVENRVDLERQFETFKLYDGSDIMPTKSLIISSNEMILSFEEGSFSLQSNSSCEYELRGYLRSEKLVDRKKIQVELSAGESGITTFSSGSSFDVENSIIVHSPEHQISIVGAELILTDKPPKIISPNEDFGIELIAVDEYGNQELNSTVEVKVSLLVGSGVLSSDSGLTRNLVDGKYTFDDLKYNKTEIFKLLIEAEGMPPIITDNISSLDVNSSIVPLKSPIQSKALNPIATSPDNSEIVFNFLVKDSASIDESPTIITAMKFFNTLPKEGLSWKRHLAGAVLKRDGEVIAKTERVEEDMITFSSLDVDITNGLQSEFELGIYFKKSLIPDHANFQVEIRNDHKWKTSSSGSSLVNELSENIVSALHQIDVNADRLSFISCPTGIEDSEKFKIIIAAVDEFKNIDVDKSSSISLNSPNGILSQTGMVGNLEDGKLEIRDLSFSGNQVLELIASGDLQSVTKGIFVQEENIIFADDFESRDLSLWEDTEDWIVSSYKPIEGSSSLKHNLSNAIGRSYIVCPLDNIQIGSESIFWEFILHNSDWAPSSTNNFVFHLLMDSNDPTLAKNLYSVGVNLSGTDDRLSLWKTSNDDSEVLIKSDFDWNENETVAVKVEYSAKGKWILSYNRLGDKSNWLEVGAVISDVKKDIENWYSGLEFNFETASRAGEFWFDDLNIESYNTAPYLKTYEFTLDSIVLSFSENLSFSESSKLDNFLLKRGDDLIPIELIKETNNKDQLVLFVEDQLVTGKYSLSINGIVDVENTVSELEEVEFDFFADAKVHDLVINEIFADESPVVGLPEYEFVEVYNTSDYSIKLNGFKLMVGNSEKVLNDYEIPSHEYLILCSNTAAEFYKEYGNVLGVSSFPSSTNSGASISLKSASGLLIDEVSFSSNWYGDESKESGGWSLERIDANNYSWQADNWKASVDKLGGTPGKKNSIEALNPDLTKPKLLSFELSGMNSIILFFSEGLDLDKALNIQNYSLNGDIGYPISVVEIEDEKFALRLNFSSDFKNSILYQLVLSSQLIDLAGNPVDEYKVEFILAETPYEGDLVINEVLFNPYPDGADYVELLNISDRKIDVKDLLIANRDENYQLDAIYPLSERSRILEAGSYLLLTTDTANVKLNYSHLDESVFIQLKKLPSFNDDEGRVVILNRNNDQLDDFAYDEGMHFSQLTSKEGVSLERINPNKETNSSSNWISASQTVDFGTPGMQNSSYDIDEVEVNEIGFKSKIFSPDNDSVDDRLIINFDLEKSGYVANIRVYNSVGREVRRLASNMTLSTKGELFWDGLLANKERAPIGIYAFYFELFHPDGDVKTYKKTCVLSGKFK